MPGGTDSNFRAWGESTIYIDRGEGGLIWDADGNEYVDLRMGYGPVILGHGDARVDDYVNERMRQGRQLQPDQRGRGPRGRARVRAHRLGRQGAPDRLGHRGDDARDARRPGLHRPREDREVRGPVPRRPRLRADQRRAGRHVGARRRRRAGRPGLGPGHPGRGRRHDHPGPLQPDRSAAHACSRSAAHEIAAIIVEPVLGNAQGIMPQPGFHQAMRALTEEFGILLIFDEVKTGFRFAKGGAAEFFGITPDLGDLRQGDGQRLSGRGVRWPRGGHERPARQGQPRRDVRRQPGRRRGRGQDARDHPRHERARDDPRDRPDHPGRPARAAQPGRHPVPLHRPSRRCSGSCSARKRRGSTATGPPRTTSCTTRSPSACTPAARCPSPTRANPGSCARRMPTPTSSTGSLTAFSDSLDAALEERAHGGLGNDPTGAMAHPSGG